MVKAKVFFGSLGKGSKARKPPDYVPDTDDVLPPPSYLESQYTAPDLPEKPELSSTTEILEIDSTEVMTPMTELPRVPSINPPPMRTINPQDLLLAEQQAVPELDCTGQVSGQLLRQTYPSSASALPAHSHNFSYASASAASAHQTVPSNPQSSQPWPRSAPPSARSKNLSPSSSVRSTTSTASNVSGTSMSSSVFSHTSSISSGSGTDFASSTTDLVGACTYGSNMIWDTFDSYDTYSSGPLDVIHELQGSVPASCDFGAQPFGFDGAPIAEEYPAYFAMDDEMLEMPTEQILDTEHKNQPQAETDAFATSFWETLQVQISCSRVKTKYIQTPYVKQLHDMEPQMIALQGLQSLRTILEGGRLTTPLDTLSLVFVIYSFSHVVYGDDASRRSSHLFAQALRYSAWHRAPQDEIQFREVAQAMWQPWNMPDAQLEQLVRDELRRSHWTSLNKGKGRAEALSDCIVDDGDLVMLTAHNFLDGTSSSLSVASDLGLWCEVQFLMYHTALETNSRADADSPMLNSLFQLDWSLSTNANLDHNKRVLASLISEFGSVAGLSEHLKQILDTICNGPSIWATRRVELEALKTGKVRANSSASGLPSQTHPTAYSFDYASEPEARHDTSPNHSPVFTF